MRQSLMLFLMVIVSSAMLRAALPDTLSGPVKGILLANHTYIVKDSISIRRGDTLHIQPGVKLVMNASTAWIDIFGAFYCEGTASNRIKIQGPLGTEGNGPGQWGGFWGDSCSVFSVKFTDIICSGGQKSDGSAFRTIDLYAGYLNDMQVVFTDNTVTKTVDDGLTVHGGNVSILRNVFRWVGAPDGDNISLKDGAWGEVAYNLVWGAGGTSVKVGSSNTYGRVTDICIHNNTLLAGGWRRLDEPGPSIRVEKNGRAEIYNNILGDCYYGIDLQKKADTVRTKYDYNLFFGSADSLRLMARYYPTDPAYGAVGRAQAHDIFGVKPDSLFVKYQDARFAPFAALDGMNDYRVLSTSTAYNRGVIPPASWANPYFGTGVQLPSDPDMGAFTRKSMTVTGVERQSESRELPSHFVLNQNFPNPFNPSTIISYALPTYGEVRLRVYNVLGEEIVTLVNEVQTAGYYAVPFNATGLPTGIYFYRLESGRVNEVKKMLLVK